MDPTKGKGKIKLPSFNRFGRLRWRLTLTISLVTLAAILMAAWWSFLAVNFYLARTLPEGILAGVRSQLLNTFLPLILPALLVLILPAVLVGSVFGFLTARWLEKRLDRLREATESWSKGDFKPRIYDLTQDEIANFGHQLNQMAVELETVLQTRQELAGLEERNQLARDLHDSVKQNLAATMLQIGAAQALLATNPQAVQNALTQAENLTMQAQQELNNVLLELRPAALHDQHLSGALQDYLDQWGLQNHIKVVYTSTINAQLPSNHELGLFRVAQEALANVSHHSGAKLVNVALKQEGPTITLQIEDNGCGFDSDSHRLDSFGIKSIHDRIKALGGSVKIDSKPGNGTCVYVNLPFLGEPTSEEKRIENRVESN